MSVKLVFKSVEDSALIMSTASCFVSVRISWLPCALWYSIRIGYYILAQQYLPECPKKRRSLSVITNHFATPVGRLGLRRTRYFGPCSTPCLRPRTLSTRDSSARLP